MQPRVEVFLRISCFIGGPSSNASVFSKTLASQALVRTHSSVIQSSRAIEILVPYDVSGTAETCFLVFL